MVLSKIKTITEPEHGDYKFEKCFAWWPTKVDGFVIWMEGYKKVYEYRIRHRVAVFYHLGIFHEGTWGQWELVTIQKLKLT